MPKILKNVRERLIAEARKQVNSNGYGGMTMRSVADGCGIGVGTAYNYFPSKDSLIAAFVLEDWLKALETMQTFPGTKTERCRNVFETLCSFRAEHRALFEDNCTGSEYSATRNMFHSVLCGQIAKVLSPEVEGDIRTEFVAAALVEWSGRNVSYDGLAPIFEAIL